MMILGAGLLIFLVWMFFRWLPIHPYDRREGGERTSRSLEILKERLAKGEITEEEFERLRKKLR